MIIFFENVPYVLVIYGILKFLKLFKMLFCTMFLGFANVLHILQTFWYKKGFKENKM